MKTLRTLGTALLVLLIFGTRATAQNGERITDFKSDITVLPNADLTIRETIEVEVQNRQIIHGLLRDFPTDYRDRLGNAYRVGFSVQSVNRDGVPETYRIETLANGKRIRIGKRSVILPVGRHVFEITYRTTRQIGFFEDHDELYWNVTGTGWLFPIDHVEAVFHLPSKVDSTAIKLDGYTGAQGATDKNFKSTVAADQPTALFETTKPLREAEGLTVVVGWPKGYVSKPSAAARIGYLLHDNPASVRMLVGLLAVTGYFLIAWILVGRDPARGTVIPRFHPPQGLSPAACRFVHRMGFDNKCFTAALINLAVKGVLKIKEYETGVVSVIKRHPSEISVSPGEAALYRKMMPYEESLALTQVNHYPIHEAIDALKEALEEEFERHYFLTNRGWFIPGIILAGAFAVYGLLGLRQTPLAFMIAFVVSVLGGALGFTLYKTLKRSVSILRLVGTALGILVIGVFLVFISGVGHLLTTGVIPVFFLTLLALTALVSLWFYELLKRPTIHGRRTMDEVEGFRMYLKTAEEDRLADLHPPEKTPQLFEQYLPYALALGVENEWAESFSQMIIAAANDPGQSISYSPTWYSGTHHYTCFDPCSITSSLGSSLTTSIASASTPPGSSSGFGSSGGSSFGGGGFGGGFSGGFSGGGGGGGGGGGW